MTKGAQGAAVAMIAVTGEPDQRQDGPDEAEPDAAPGHEPAAAARILLVEDDYLVGVEMEGALAEAGFAVTGIAATAEEAMLLAGRDRPKLVVMDIRLAGERDGIDAAIEIERRFGIRALFASAHGDAETRVRGEAARPLGWIGKPYRIPALVAAVRDALARLDEGAAPGPMPQAET